MARRALICGVSGQDGAYLARLLLEKGYDVWGTSRDVQQQQFRGLDTLGILRDVRLESMSPTDFRSVAQTLKRAAPDEIYNLAGQSSVGLSFDQPVETLESIALGALNLLEAIRFTGASCRLYNAASSECFGDTGDVPADETTPFRPRSPYAVAKCTAFWTVANYREAYGLFACSGLLFNHESPLRPQRFVTRKIASAAARISRGDREPLTLGNIDVRRDWGWAPDYVDAMWRMLQQKTAEDFVIATGETSSLSDFVAAAFDAVSLDWRAHVKTDASLRRPTDLSVGRANPKKAATALGWEAKVRMREVARRMVEAELEQRSAT